MHPIVRRALLTVLMLSVAASIARAQSPGAEEFGAQKSSAIARATDYSIPSAPALGFLDAGPAAVHTPHFPRDFRLDWLLQDGQIASDLAIEAAPVWLFGFEDVSAAEYRSLPTVARTLSTFNVSVATTANGRQRTLAAAAKLTLYRASDPVADTSYTNRLSRALGFSAAQTQAQNEIDEVVIEAADALSDRQFQVVDALADRATQFGEFKPSSLSAYQRLPQEEKRTIASYVQRLEEAHRAMQAVSDATADQLRAIRRQYEQAHWNDARLDVAAGRVYTFDQFAGAGRLDSLSLAATEWGAWLNGATGLGTQDWLVSGLVRVLDREGETTYFVGGNVRYGGDDANFFVEYARRWGDRSVESLVSYGGSLSLMPQLNVQFGLRTTFDGTLRLDGLAPTIKLNGQTAGLLSSIPL